MTAEAEHMFAVLRQADGDWVSWQECIPESNDPTIALQASNELRHEGHGIERRGEHGSEEYRLADAYVATTSDEA